jgi:hypothetical protein
MPGRRQIFEPPKLRWSSKSAASEIFAQGGRTMGNQNFILTSQAAATASGTSSVPLDVSYMTEIAAFLVVRSASGTSPTLTLTLQDSPDGVNWANLYSFPAVISGSMVLRAAWSDMGMCIGRYLQASWMITGTLPSFAFSVSVVAISVD